MIGIYAHHHGSGHVQRALSVAAALDDEVTLLTSARIRDDAVPDPGRVRVVTLPLDVGGSGDGAGPDPTAGGRLHWVPLRHDGLRRRMAILAEWIDRHMPTVFWSDISVEVTVGARLTGTPVVSTVLPGRQGERPRVLHLRGSGGGGHDGRWDAVRDELGEVDWISLGGPGGRWVADPWDELCRADVVISAAGQSSIADLAAADAYVVVAPEERPFGEQDATAATLARLGLAEVVGRDDPVDQLVGAVRRTLEAARSTPGAGSGLREAWEVDGAPERLAGVLEAVADGREAGVERPAEPTVGAAR
ncbi:hypothetical protein ES5_12295 [Dietzia cinnamea P4]|nr:hypothetical protein ES5_12295 [Dietzia cinnamea P4]